MAQDTTDRLIDMLRDRRELGRVKYGHSLYPNNGRDALQDAIEEALDCCQYLLQRVMELELELELKAYSSLGRKATGTREMRERWRRAYSEGRVAAKYGQSLQGNPYKEETRPNMRHGWGSGWKDRDQETRQMAKRMEAL